VTLAEALAKARVRLDEILLQAKETSTASFAESDLPDDVIAELVDDFYKEFWPGAVEEVLTKVARVYELGDEVDCLSSLELH
jgi:hypothetical protein